MNITNDDQHTRITEYLKRNYEEKLERPLQQSILAKNICYRDEPNMLPVDIPVEAKQRLKTIKNHKRLLLQTI